MPIQEKSQSESDLRDLFQRIMGAPHNWCVLSSVVAASDAVSPTGDLHCRTRQPHTGVPCDLNDDDCVGDSIGSAFAQIDYAISRIVAYRALPECLRTPPENADALNRGSQLFPMVPNYLHDRDRISDS
ncbi:hypothetical protein N7462_004570 [Penicillium macrosclerotiorum]|uniref:uncharacterized protein n=1 Tax=Penicillium macrosclerotiorum TaxID=303699 RepID=UPI0025490AC2|nr:uncharacterized protein N7462_004570 [Penicillium macrosclerotiorum]KAJ5690178.1 hypothetical protein N7462_004570 [Penicillium macrosclerotiorum]